LAGDAVVVHVIDDLGVFATPRENNSGTSDLWIHAPTPAVNDSGQNAHARATGACSFVVADWRQGREPFCGAATRPGSSYCARHEPLCIVPRESVEGRARVAALIEDAEATPEPPPELAYLRESAVPEPLPDDVGDLSALLDHAPPDPGTRETD